MAEPYFIDAILFSTYLTFVIWRWFNILLLFFFLSIDLNRKMMTNQTANRQCNHCCHITSENGWAIWCLRCWACCWSISRHRTLSWWRICGRISRSGFNCSKCTKQNDECERYFRFQHFSSCRPFFGNMKNAFVSAALCVKRWCDDKLRLGFFSHKIRSFGYFSS